MTLKKAIAKVQSLMVWVRERPQMYASTVGELDLVLDYLHGVWAMLTDRQEEYDLALKGAGQTARRVYKDSERCDRVDATSKSTKKVLRFWAKVDKQLKVEVLCDTWVD